MISITPLSSAVSADKQRWIAVGRKILAHHNCEETISEIGRCIDLWKEDRRVPEPDLFNALGFYLGEMLIAEFGGTWVWVIDQFGQCPAIQRTQDSNVANPLERVAKQLHGASNAEHAIQSFVTVYFET